MQFLNPQYSLYKDLSGCQIIFGAYFWIKTFNSVTLIFFNRQPFTSIRAVRQVASVFFWLETSSIIVCHCLERASGNKLTKYDYFPYTFIIQLNADGKNLEILCDYCHVSSVCTAIYNNLLLTLYIDDDTICCVAYTIFISLALYTSCSKIFK